MSGKEYIHWITPGTYDDNPSVVDSRNPLPDDQFKAGDKVRCIETWHPKHGEYLGQNEGDVFTVRAYVKYCNYFIFEECEHGFMNCERFELV